MLGLLWMIQERRQGSACRPVEGLMKEGAGKFVFHITPPAVWHGSSSQEEDASEEEGKESKIIDCESCILDKSDGRLRRMVSIRGEVRSEQNMQDQLVPQLQIRINLRDRDGTERRRYASGGAIMGTEKDR